MSKLGLTLAIVGAAALGAATAEWARGAEARAAAPKAVEPGRWQISAYGYAMPNGEQRQGVFILDGETGDIFQMATGAGTEKVGRVPAR